MAVNTKRLQQDTPIYHFKFRFRFTWNNSLLNKFAILIPWLIFRQLERWRACTSSPFFFGCTVEACPKKGPPGKPLVPQNVDLVIWAAACTAGLYTTRQSANVAEPSTVDSRPDRPVSLRFSLKIRAQIGQRLQTAADRRPETEDCRL